MIDLTEDLIGRTTPARPLAQAAAPWYQLASGGERWAST